MTIQPVYFGISPKIEAGLASRDLIRRGGVVRDGLGRIVEHLPEVQRPDAEDVQNVLGRVAAAVRNPWAIASVTAGAVIAIGGIVFLVAKKRYRGDVPEVSEVIDNYGTSLRTYVDAVRDGRLDADIIERLIADLDAVKANADSGSITLDLSTEQFEALMNLVIDYTRKLAEVNSVELRELEDPPSGSDSHPVIDLRCHLDAQRQIFTRAA